MSLRPEINALKKLRDEHRLMTLAELEESALIELIKMHRILDDLTWPDDNP